jgi:filamentous hemagglutinin family protein
VDKPNKYLALLVTLFLIVPTNGFCLPHPNEVVSGGASFSVSDNTMQVATSDKVIINYDSFNISDSEAVRFIQPCASSCALNRVISSIPSDILGSLSANGRIFLVNPNGIFFGPNARIDTGSFLASTLDISNEDFLSENYNFFLRDGIASSIVNKGEIRVSDGEFVALISPNIANEGLIQARLGKVALISGENVSLDFTGDGLINFAVEQNIKDAIIKNKGIISSDGGEVLISVNAAKQAIEEVINNEGIIQARSLVNNKGCIRLIGSGGGIVANRGTVDASAAEANASGGRVIIEGSKVGQFGQIRADAVDGNGGNINLYADDVVALSPDSLTTANAGFNGDGGEVIIFSPKTALFWSDARIEARGGKLCGDGGFIEVSGKEHVEIYGLVDIGAPAGEAGLFLTDPNNISIQSAAGEVNITGATPFQSTDDSAILSISTLLAALGGGDVVVQTMTAGANIEDGNITLGNILNYNGIGAARTLTLQAHNNINISNDIVDAVPGGESLSLVLTADSDTSSAGDVNINDVVNTGGGTFTANGVGFDNTGGTITTGGGAVTINNTGTVTVAAEIDATGAAAAISFTNPGSLTLGADLSTDGAGVTVGGDNDIIINAATVTIDTESGDDAAAGAINFGASNIYANAASYDLVLNSNTDSAVDNGGTVTVGVIDDNDGGDSYIDNLTINSLPGAGGTAGDINLQAVTTTGTQLYYGTTVLNGDLTTTTSDNTITLGNHGTTLGADVVITTAGGTNDNVETSTVNGAHSLTIDAGIGDVTLGGNVGAAIPLTEVDIDGRLVSIALVSTTGEQNYHPDTSITLRGNLTRSDNSWIYLSAPVLLNDTDDAAITITGSPWFSSTINSTSALTPNSLTITGGGVAVLGSTVGTTTPLKLLDVTAGGSGIILYDNITTADDAANAVTLTGNVTLRGDVEIDCDTDNNDGAINITGTVETQNGTESLILNAGGENVTIGGAVGATTSLGGLTIDGNDISVDDIGGAAAGVTGATALTAADAGADAGSIALTGTTYNANQQTYDAGATTNAITLGGGGDTTFTSTGDAIQFTGAVDGAVDLTLAAGTGDTTFNGAVGGTTPIGDGNGAAITINSTGTTSFESTVETDSGITQADTAGTVTFKDNLTCTIGAAGTAVVFNGDVVLDGLDIDVAGGGAAGTLTFGNEATDQVTLSGGEFGLKNTGAFSDTTFNSKVDGAQNVVINCGKPVIFNAPVGSTTPIGSGTGAALTIVEETTFNSTLGTASGIIGSNACPSLTFKDNVTISGGDTASEFRSDLVLDGLTLTSDAAITFGNGAGDDVTLSSAAVTVTTASGNGAQDWQNCVLDGSQGLTINTGSGALTLPDGEMGATNNLDYFIANCGSISDIDNDLTTTAADGVSITVTGAGNTINQTLGTITTGGNPVVLQGDDIDLGGSIDAGAENVTLRPNANGRQIDLGTDTAGKLGLTDTDLDAITAAKIIIGSTSSGAIASTNNIDTANTSSMQIITGSTINTSNNTLTEATLDLDAVGNVTLGLLNATGAVDVTSSGASILDGNGTANNIAAGANSTLWAGQTIGISTDAMDVNVSGGSLSVYSNGSLNDVSVNIDGTVSPSNTLTLLNTPPGLVLFNDIVLSGETATTTTTATAATTTTLTNAAEAQSNPYLANEMPLLWLESLTVNENTFQQEESPLIKSAVAGKQIAEEEEE